MRNLTQTTAVMNASRLEMVPYYHYFLLRSSWRKRRHCIHVIEPETRINKTKT